MPRLIIVTEVRLYLEGLADVLRRQDGVEVAGTAATYLEALDLLTDERPQVVLLDSSMPTGLELCARMARVAPEVRIVALGLAEEEKDVLAFAEAGVAGYVPRNGSFEDLVSAIKCAERGELLCSPRIAATLFRHAAASLRRGARGEPDLGLSSLTRREIEILDLISAGLSNKEIAGRLGIELATVKNHVHHLLQKLGVTRRVDAAQRGREVAVPFRSMTA